MPAASPAGARTRRRLAIAVLGTALLAALAAPALGVSRSSAENAISERAAQVFDSRTTQRASVRAAVDASRDAGSQVRSARARELKRIGSGGKLQLDPLTGTPRSFQNLSGTLSGSTGGSPASVAMSFARSHAAVLGLSSADLDALGAPKVVTSPSGISSVRFSQSYQGIRAYDNDLRINLDRVNRVLSVTGSPVHDLSVASVTPKLSAGQALSALAKSLRAGGSVSDTSAGDSARLVLFHGASGTRLAWHLTYEASSSATYDAVIDATTGEVLRRANTVQNVNASVFENYPGDVNGGTQQTVNIDPYLLTGAPVLSGPFARTFLDLDDNNAPGAGEEVTPGPYTFTPATAPNGFCLPTKLCGWDPDTPGSWAANQNEAAVQAHYYVSKFHDHLLGAPIGFDAASGNFEGSDRVIVNVDNGAATGPDNAHVNNVNMFTPADGSAPRMQLYLFKNRGLGVYRAINSADDGRLVYHEYTHGLSNRLITGPGGSGALLSAQSASMGEGWSDWFALDYLAAQGLETDTAASGEIDMGEYTDGTPHINRFEPIDCPPDAGGSNCPGGEPSGGAGSGGFTYADFGHICCTPGNITPEIHSDGEIWAQTLWDIRTALGSSEAERLITDGMRLSPAEPSFLDARNAIIAADAAAPSNGSNREALWQIFADRGMGFYAYAADGNDVAPLANFSPPPPPGTPMGAIAGRVTDMDTGLPVSGVFVGVAGHITDPTFPDYLAATSGSDGRYSIAVPAGTYPVLVVPPAGGYDAGVNIKNVTVTAGATAPRDAAVRRDWAAAKGGAEVSGNDNFGGDVCGQTGLNDQSLARGYSAFSPAGPAMFGNTHPGEEPYAVIELPRAITVYTFAVDPAANCGDDATATTKDYTIETSADGVNFAPAKQGTFAPEDAGRLNFLNPTANAANVKFVKITSNSAQRENPGDSGELFYDITELAVYGNAPNVLPSGTLSASPGSVVPGQAVTLTAAFTDPDSAITGYDWDFDGDGRVDQSTAGPSTTTSYPTPGNRLAKVAAKDFRGNSGSASATVAVVKGASLPALPELLLRSKGSKGLLAFNVKCFSACRVTAKLTVDRKTARKLGLRRLTVGSGVRTIRTSKTTTVRIRLSRKVVSAMRRHGARSITGTMRVTATYADGRRKVASKKASVRR